MRKMHGLRPLPYETTVNWTLCSRHVKREQIAAFDDGITCRQCRAILKFRAECEVDKQFRSIRKCEDNQP